MRLVWVEEQSLCAAAAVSDIAHDATRRCCPPTHAAAPRHPPTPPPLRFATHLSETDPLDLKPVFAYGDVSYAYMQHNNIYIVALTRRNSNVTSVFVFLERLVEIMKEYFGTLEEESIRDNFVLIYELLDEVMDHGYPQVAEAKVLKEYITQGARRLEVQKPPQAVTNMVSWRTEGIKHKKNEVFLDVVEKLNLLVAANGSVLSCEIIGAIRMRSFLR